MKTCSKCGIEKPFDKFYRRVALKSGYRSECKICSGEYDKGVRDRRRTDSVLVSESKICPRCGNEKPSKDFNKKVTSSTGLGSLCKKCFSIQQRLDYDSDKKHWQWVQRKYHISESDYYQLLKNQDGRCAVCGVDNPNAGKQKFFHIDHDHTTGKLRGLLCLPCNTGIGSLGDNLEGLEAAVAYLRKNK